jgi:hypothetical protein
LLYGRGKANSVLPTNKNLAQYGITYFHLAAPMTGTKVAILKINPCSDYPCANFMPPTAALGMGVPATPFFGKWLTHLRR